MTAAPEVDPYLLPFPTQHGPVVLPHVVTALHAHLNARYADSVWSLSPLTENPSARKSAIYWHQCPPAFQDEIRLATWNLINGQLRPTFLKAHGTQLRARLSLSTIGATTTEWMRLATWLEARNIHSLARCDTDVLHDYGKHLLATHSNRARVQKILVALTRLWAVDEISARPAGIGQPPWDKLGADDYLPAATSTSGENETEPLAEQTMGPLLIWAIRMVDDLANDILAAWAERQRLVDTARMSTDTAATEAALRAYFTPLITAQAPLPTVTHMGKTALARSYISGLTGASGNQIKRFARREGLHAAAARRPGPCPLSVPVTGQIAGTRWGETIDYYETPNLIRHLGTAAFVVCSYLTGMRPGEVLGMRTGCCPDPAPDADGNIGRHLIRSSEYKTATDEHGNHQSAGVERDVPWVAIGPVVNAICILERMVPDGHLLFDRVAHDTHSSRPGTGALKTSGLHYRIDDFIAWANTQAATHQLSGEIIPPDPHGNIGPARFRRSLAWHIARRPNGLVALAIQYGHLRTTFVAGGYASRSRSGIHDLIDIETVRAVTDTVAELHDDLEAGGGVSGPAARRAIKAAAHAPRFAGTTITATTARRLLANEDALLYDNPHALLLCHYKRAQALCHRDGVKVTPSLDHCVPGCGNIIRTDQQAALLRAHADTHGSTRITLHKDTE